MLFAGFNVAEGEYSPARGRRWSARSANLVGSWIAYAVGYYGRIELLEKHGKQAAHQALAPRVGRPLVRALRRRRPSSSRMLPIIRTFISLPGRRRADAVLALHACFTVRSAASRGSSCSTFIGKQVGDNWDGLEGHAALRRLRGRGADRRRASSTSSCAGGAAAARGRAAPMRGLTARCRCATRSRSGVLHGPGRAAAGLLLGPHRRSCRGCSAGPTRELDPRAAQGVRGRAARRHRGGAAGRACATRSARPRAGSTAAARRWSLGSFVPPAVVGLHARAPDRAAAGHAARRSPAGLLAGSAAMAAADRAAPTGRRREEAGLRRRARARLAQACALVPGVSRNGATLAAARLRGFDRADANALSRHVALPVIVGATALKGARLAAPRAAAGARRAPSPPASAPSFASTLGLDAADPRRSSATARSRPTPPTAPRSRRLVLRRALAESVAMSDAYAAAGVDTGAGRPRASARSSTCCARSSPAARRASVLAARPLRQRAAGGADDLGIALSHRRRRLEAHRRRAGRPLDTVGHRLRRDERQRPRLRRRRADRAARLPRGRAGRPRRAGARSPTGLKVGAEAAGVEIPGGELARAARADPRPSLAARLRPLRRPRSAPSRSTRSSPARDARPATR